MSERRQNRSGGLVAGIILIAFGCIFLLDRFVVVDFGHLIGRYWPMFVVLIGVVRLSEPHRVWSGLWLIAVGAWMQVSHLGLFGLSWRTSWPILLIVAGAGLIVRAVAESVAQKEEGNVR